MQHLDHSYEVLFLVRLISYEISVLNFIQIQLQYVILEQVGNINYWLKLMAKITLGHTVMHVITLLFISPNYYCSVFFSF